MSPQRFWGDDDDIDFALVYADDAYLDDLGGAVPGEPVDELAAMLLAWRDAVDAEPIHELAIRRRSA